LRAIAVLLVIASHAGVTLLAGGYVGVDVFFVLSGFLITGLLLREYLSSGRISITRFYARRIRRILPAGTLVLLATLLGTYLYLGSNGASRVAGDAQWSALFASNVRFIELGTNYMSAQLPPSPLQHFWSLAVEEQFYAVWPVLIIMTAWLAKGAHLRKTLGAILVLLVVVSLTWSIWQTPNDAAVAYFSPLTRVWELAAGALLAVATPALLRLPSRLGVAMSVIGVAAIMASGLLFNDATPFPGYAAALPVAGAALAVAGGTCAPGLGAEVLLRLRPFQWLGMLSYSLYLWHWPLLTIAKEAAGRDLLPGETALFCLLALVLSIATFWLIENPVRNSRWLKRRSPLISLGVGACLVLASFGVATGMIAAFATHSVSPRPAPVVVFPSH
jgi:peptidoglycan/LPS O-acetylase OafA/YrhL